MTLQELKDFFRKNKKAKINLSTKNRKEILILNDLSFFIDGELFIIKFKDLKGGVWESFVEIS